MFRIIALITMVIDHVGLVFFPDYLIFRVIGRLAFPLFAFGIAQGYLYTKNLSKYLQRILLLALISQPIFYLLINHKNLNICFTLTLGLIAIYLYDKGKEWWIKVFGILFILFFGQWLNVEYGAYGILLILCFYIFRNNILLILFGSLLVFAQTLLNYSQILNLFAIIPLFLV
ncbi:MAG TPA: TraX family protein, partial [bacterium]|nr:TraX family protein [bacterium]